MKKIKSIVLFVLLSVFLISIVACSGDVSSSPASQQKPKAFTIGNASFETLQEAVDSIGRTKDAKSINYTITLNFSVTDAGAEIPDISGSLTLNLGSYTYTLSEGSKGIVVSNPGGTVIENGSIAVAPGASLADGTTSTITATANLTVADVKINLENSDVNGIEASSGTVELKGSTAVTTDGDKKTIVVTETAIVNVAEGSSVVLTGGLKMEGSASVDLGNATINLTAKIEKGEDVTFSVDDTDNIKPTESLDDDELADINSSISEALHVHKWVEDKERSKEPTCTEEGFLFMVCSEDSNHTKTVTVPAKGHDFSEEWTCSETHHWHAANCAHTEEISGKAEHSWTKREITIEPTETSEGEEILTCGVCGYQKTQVISKIEWDNSQASLFAKGTEEYSDYDIVYISDNHQDTLIVPEVYDNEIVRSVFIDASIDNLRLPHGLEKIAVGLGNGEIESINIPETVSILEVGQKLKSVTLEGESHFKIIDNCVYDLNGLSLVKVLSNNSDHFSIPDSVENVGPYAFAYCSDLKSISIPASVALFGKSVFSGCNIEKVYIENLEAWCRIVFSDQTASPLGITFNGSLYLNNELLTSVVVPDSITRINDYAFFGCSSITSVSISSSLTEIGLCSFAYCENLETINLPNSLVFIGVGSFKVCKSLTSITIPETVIQIGDGAFALCSSLSSFVFLGTRAQWEAISKGFEWNSSVPGEVQFLNDNTGIETGSDIGWTITSGGVITPTDKSEVVGDIVILSEVDGIAVTSIGYRAFENCASLTSIIIPSSITSIEGGTFSGCTSLTSITIPDSVTSIGEAFYECTSLKNVYISSLSAWCKIDFEYPESNPMFYADNLYVNDSLLSGHVEIPADVITIPNDAFRHCKNITSIVIPVSVTSIGMNAFSGCESLESITIPDSVTSIESGAFSGCTSLMSISFSGTKKQWFQIPKGMFWNNGVPATVIRCSDVDVKVDYIQWDISDGAIYPSGEFETVTGDIEIPFIVNGTTVTSIRENAFYGCRNLTGIVIPDTVTSIGECAFKDCSALSEVTIPDSVKTIGMSAFSGCSSLESIVIPESISCISCNVFENCSSLTDVTIPSSVTSIESGAFCMCYNLKNVYVSDLESWCKVSIIGDIETSPLCHAENLYVGGQLLSGVLEIPYGVEEIPAWAFRRCTGITSVIIPNSVEYIRDHAFSGCTKLESITIPDSVESIDWYAFEGCISLKSITLPDSVLGLADAAFYGCTGLESISIPASVSWIGGGVFSNCTSLKSVTIGNLVTRIGSGAFSDCTALSSIVIPSSVESIEDGAFYNCTSLSSITYLGTSAQWASISKGFEWKLGVPTGVVHCADVDMPIYLDAYWEISSSGEINPIYKDLVSGSIAIPQEINGITVTSIGNNAFKDCTGLESITIPDSVTKIGDLAFSNCSSLSSVTYLGTSAQWEEVSKGSEWNNSVPATSIDCSDADVSISDWIINSSGEITPANKELVSGAVEIPSEINGISVTCIGADAFFNCKNLTSITIPVSVTNIGSRAFCYCTNLTSINYSGNNNQWESIAKGSEWNASISTSVVHCIDGNSNIENGSNISWTITSEGVISPTNKSEGFGEIVIPSEVNGIAVTRIEELAFSDCTSLTNIIIPDSVTSIGYRAFYGCISLSSITIPDSVTSIEEIAFYGCTSLTDITIPDSVTDIEELAFYGCTSLTSIAIPDSVKRIGGQVFLGCTSLESVTIGNSVTCIGRYSFSGCTSLTSIIIPDSVTSIEEGAFSGCTSLTSIIIPDSVISVGYGAFSNCINLESVMIGNSTNRINTSTFYGCTKLESIFIPNSVTRIEDRAFLGCTSLTDISIPNSVTSIGCDAFSDCTSITSIIIPDSVTSIKDRAFSGCTNLESVTISNAVTSINNNTFYKCASLKSIVIPDSVTSIGNDAFFGCASLTDIFIPNSVTSIGYNAFSGCTSLTNIIIPDLVTSIAARTFVGCTSLESITIGSSVNRIGLNAFSNCESLDKVYISNLSSWCKIDFDSNSFNPLYYASNLFLNGSLLSGHLEIPADVTTISKYAFSGYKGVTSITVPDSVISIEDHAFSSCTNLESVIIGNSVTSIGNGAFYGCTNLTNIAIPNLVTSIGDGAFYGCTNLTDITIPDSVTVIGGSAFSDCTSLTSITIPDSVTVIGGGAFYGCSSLTSIAIGDSVTSIGSYAFYKCTGLTSITIPDSVTSIEEHAFYDCTSLTSITIPDSVTSIWYWAFSGCTSLASINYSGTKAQWAAVSWGGYWSWKDWIPAAAVVHCTDGDLYRLD